MPRPNRATIDEYKRYLDGLGALEGLDRGGRQEFLGEVRELCLRDLHAFCVLVMGATCMTPRGSRLHGRLCDWLMRWEETKPKKLLLMSRGFMKSTVATVGHSLWIVARNPEERVLICSATENISEAFMRQIMAVVEGPVWRCLFPEYVPDRKVWSFDRASLAMRGRLAREANWTVGSLRKGITGGHYTAIKWDDLVIPENVGTRDMARWVIDKFRELAPLKDSWFSQEVIIGTPYTNYDLYSWLLEVMADRLDILRIPIGERDAEGRWVPNWPEEYPRIAIEELQRDSAVFWPQYALEPNNQEMTILWRGDIEYFAFDDEEVPSGVDIACRVGRDELAYYLGYDPTAGSEDMAAMVVVGVDENGMRYVVEAYGETVDINVQIEQLFSIWQRWGVERGYVEMTGGFKVLETLLQREMAERKRWLYLEQFPAVRFGGKQERNTVALQNIYRRRRILHHWRLKGTDFEGQLLDFPRGKHDDFVDALAMAVTMTDISAPYALGRKEREEWRGRGRGLPRYINWPHIAFTLEELATDLPEEIYYEALRDAVAGIYRAGERYDG